MNLIQSVSFPLRRKNSNLISTFENDVEEIFLNACLMMRLPAASTAWWTFRAKAVLRILLPSEIRIAR